MCFVESKKSKGFTLVELIVVIAIVAILAAVSIVGYQSYISKARVSNDVTDAKNMTNVLNAYVTLHNVSIDDLDANYVHDIVNIDNDYSFIPRVEGYSFWFDKDSMEIVYGPSYEMMESEDTFELFMGKGKNTMLLNDLGSSELDTPSLVGVTELEEVVPGYFLLDLGGESQISRLISGIRNFRTMDIYTEVATALAVDHPVRVHLTTTFAATTTLFVNDFFSYTAATTKVTKVVFARGIESIPASAFSTLANLEEAAEEEDEFLEDLEIILPLSVSVIESGSIVPLSGKTIQYRSIEEIRVEEGAFASNDSANTALIQKEGSVNLEEISFQISYISITTRVYSVSTVETVTYHDYLGKRVGSSAPYTYYDANGTVVTSGDSYVALTAAFGTTVNILRITTVDTNITLDFTTTLANSSSGKAIHAFRMTYYEKDGKMIAEAKAYDENGTLFSKGTVATTRTMTAVSWPTA